MKKIAVESLDSLFAAIAAQQKLYLPAEIDRADKKEAVYTEWKEGTVYSEALNTLRSAKDFFFPQIQDMAKFRRAGKTIEVIDDRAPVEPYVVFGVRACDVRSFDVLDRVFLADPVDTYYEERRSKSTIMSMACGRPAETCFCTSFDIDPAEPAGDVQCWKDHQFLYMEAKTEKGEALLAQLSAAEDAAGKALLAECEEQDASSVDAAKAAVRTMMTRLPLKDLKPVDNRDRELAVFKSEQWKELASHCLGCGSCTFVCPTCQCFDIEEFNQGETIQRYRCWDSCMYNDFTLMAAGTPRLTQTERFRQRFMHKLVYYPVKNDGMYSCVGCGRCLKKCPIHMNIAKVMQSLEKEFPAADSKSAQEVNA